MVEKGQMERGGFTLRVREDVRGKTVSESRAANQISGNGFMGTPDATVRPAMSHQPRQAVMPGEGGKSLGNKTGLKRVTATLDPVGACPLFTRKVWLEKGKHSPKADVSHLSQDAGHIRSFPSYAALQGY